MVEPVMNSVEGFYFDTRNTISAYCDLPILRTAIRRCAYFHDLLSKTVPGSDVWRINHAQGAAVQVSTHTMNILRTAVQVSEASGGAFNIAIEPVSDLWRFKDAVPHFPEQQALAVALARADYQQIDLGEETVSLPPEVQIDLGGIAKGYIADCIAQELRENGVTSALLNFGGNVITIGCKPDGNPWTIGLQTPGRKRGEDFWAAIYSVDSTVVTSGVYERGFEIEGVRYHHILDPRTGWPVQNGLLAVTVHTQNSMIADALTTAIFVLGKQEGSRLAQQYNVQAVFLSDDGTVTYSEGLDIVFVR